METRQRKRSIDKALGFLDEHLRLPPARRQKARQRIRGARRPLLEAKKVLREGYQKVTNERTSDALRVRLEQINDVTWKLTDGVISEPEGRLDPPTTRARAWIAGYGWSRDGKRPDRFTAYRKVFFLPSGEIGGDAHDVPEGESDGFTTWSYPAASFAEAEEAARAMVLGWDEYVSFVAARRDDLFPVDDACLMSPSATKVMTAQQGAHQRLAEEAA